MFSTKRQPVEEEEKIQKGTMGRRGEDRGEVDGRGEDCKMIKVTAE